MFGSRAVILAATLLVGDVPAEKAFQEFGDFVVGGVWTGTDARGDKVEDRWEWVLDKSFLKESWNVTGDAGLSIVGIDPATGKWSAWGFDDKGRLWMGFLDSQRPGEWTVLDTGHSKGGPGSWKARTTKLSSDSARLEILENVVDGKTFPPETLTQTRKKETTPPAAGGHKDKAVKKDRTVAEKAFQEFADLAVGGVWTARDAQGTKLQDRWEWILDKSFLQWRGKAGDESGYEIHGIDPATGRWTYWGFDDKGRVYKGVAESYKRGGWSFHNSGHGKAGPNSWKAKLTKFGDDITPARK